MSLNLAAPLYAAVTAESDITDLLGTFNGEPSVHTRRPVPASAGYPLVAISPDVAVSENDGINDERPAVTRDLAVYGEAANHYRDVETVAYKLRELFHRKRAAISVVGYAVVDIRCSGPRVAPVDDEARVGRAVEVTVLLARK